MTKINYHTLPAFFIKPENESMASLRGTKISIADEGGGCFICITQEPDSGTQEIGIDIEEWPSIKEAIDKLIPFCEAENCKTYED